MSNLRALTENAKANSKGFVADGVVTYAVAAEYKSQGYEFCLRLISLDPKDTNPQVATDRELFGIMSKGTGGGALSLMPLVKVESSNGQTDAQGLLARLDDLGMPLNITLWLDEESLKEQFNSAEAEIKKYREAWAEFVIAAGYSVGYYKGGLCDCSCNSSTDSGSTVLDAAECGGLGNGSTLKTVSIGDNTGNCKVRWAYLNS